MHWLTKRLNSNENLTIQASIEIMTFETIEMVMFPCQTFTFKCQMYAQNIEMGILFD